MNPEPGSATAASAEDIAAFLREHGAGDDLSWQPMPGGANNRVYRVPGVGGDRVLKCYFHGPGDPRDRFRAEQAFYDWAWSQGVRRTPEPLAWCDRRRLGLFAFVPGRKLKPEEVNLARVQEALEFIDEINAARRRPPAKAIPRAAEACFSVAEHLACVDRRLERVQQIPPRDTLDQQAAAFVHAELAPAWNRLREVICRATVESGLGVDAPLADVSRCLSPSDFGFHNAILAPDQRLRFFDFEYAGWDDPAKLVCDFFCQPELPVNLAHWDFFRQQTALRLEADAAMPERARLLLPAYRVKWCCIVLNEFVHSEQRRRTFAAGANLPASRKAAQLAKARQLLAKAIELRPGEA